MTELPLDIALGPGWRVALAHIREGGVSPLVLVTLEHDGAEHHVRVDVDKRMVVDSPPTEIPKTALAEIVEQVGKKRREVLLASLS